MGFVFMYFQAREQLATKCKKAREKMLARYTSHDIVDADEGICERTGHTLRRAKDSSSATPDLLHKRDSSVRLRCRARPIA
jgi:hypothetical protein